MLCGVTATLGSNPSATATAARPRWGRAVLLCPSGVCPWAALSCPSALLFEVPQWFPSNVARNSPATASSIESWSLELQRLWPISKNDRVKLRATLLGNHPGISNGRTHRLERDRRSGEPGRGSHRRQIHSTLTYFACNSPRATIEESSKTAEFQRSDFKT